MPFRPNPAFERQVQTQPRWRAGMATITVGVAHEIRVAALPFRDTGNYIGRVEPRGTIVELERHFAHIMEFGSIHNKPQANARRGTIAAGLDFRDDHDAVAAAKSAV